MSGSEYLRGRGPAHEWPVLGLRSCVLGVACGVAGALVFAVAPALAAAPEAPETKPVSPIGATAATFNGVLNPGANPQAGTYEFLYKKLVNGAGCEGESATSPGIVTEFEVKRALSEPVGLEPNTKYTVCLAMRNIVEEMTVGNAVSFSTPAIAPTVESESSSLVPPSAGDPHPSATREIRLEGVVNPNNEATECHFQYEAEEPALKAPTTSLCEPGSFPASFGGQGVALNVSGLEANKTYYYRVVANNGAGETKGTKSEPIKKFVTERLPETPEKTAATGILATTATLSGELRPGGQEYSEEPGSYEFLYRASATECTGAGQKAAPAPAGVAHGKPQERVSVQPTGLQPGTEYTFCLLVRNEAGEASLPSAPVTFTTISPFAPMIEPESESVTNVAATSATLNAIVNPQGAATTYAFEYAPAGGAFAPVPEPGASGTLPEGASGIPLSVHMQQGLAAGNTYEFRVTVGNSVRKEVEGKPVSFTMQTANTGLVLPDGRQWELVSPPDKGGAKIEPIPALGGVIQAAEGGGAVTYVANFAVGAGAQGNPAPSYTQLSSARDAAGGWSTQDIATAHNGAFGSVAGHSTEYLFFSSDLSRGLVEPPGETPLPPLGEGAEKTIYIREADGSYVPLVTAANVTSGERFGGAHFEGATPDMRHIVLRSGVPLTSGPEVEGEGLYEWSAGALQPVSVSPGGTAVEASKLGHDEVDTRNAISEDGSRVFWAPNFGAENLFMRQMTSDETIQLNSVEADVTGGCVEAGTCERGPGFQVANRSGSEALFTDEARLTSNSTAESEAPDLYMFEVTSNMPLAGKLTDLTVDHEQPADVQGTVIGSGENPATKQFTSVYFVAKGVLAENENEGHENAVTGADNLYVMSRDGSGWKTMFIARLAEGDGDDWEAQGHGLEELTARVSPDGEYLAFMSDQSLTGYDNRDAKSGERDEEVFLYHAATASLVCASCDPTGARPLGVYDPVSGPQNNFASLVVDESENWSGRWLAGSIPGWTNFRLSHARYQSRYLSDSGRLFFDSPDTLVPQATNGVENVFEYEPGGVGSCEGTSSIYSPRSAGCTSLISSGTSAGESAFVDASESGDDVFFVTNGKLVPQDADTAYDMYDAHVCSSAAPCPSASVVVPPACTTADSCRVAASPQPQIFGSPSSETFSGAGNAPPVPLVTPKKVTKKTVKCKRGFVKNKKNKCIPKKTKKAKKSSAKRASRDRRAQS